MNRVNEVIKALADRGITSGVIVRVSSFPTVEITAKNISRQDVDRAVYHLIKEEDLLSLSLIVKYSEEILEEIREEFEWQFIKFVIEKKEYIKHNDICFIYDCKGYTTVALGNMEYTVSGKQKIYNAIQDLRANKGIYDKHC